MSADRTTLVLAPATASRVEAADEAVKDAIKRMKGGNGAGKKKAILRVQEALNEWLRAVDEAAGRRPRCTEVARVDDERKIIGVVIEYDASSRSEAYSFASNCTGVLNYEDRRVADDKFVVRVELDGVLRAILAVTGGVDYYKDGVRLNAKARFPTTDYHRFIAGHAHSLAIHGFPPTFTEELRESILAHFSFSSCLHKTGGITIIYFNERDDADLAGAVLHRLPIAGFCTHVVPLII